jgi:hypothetical protein
MSAGRTTRPVARIAPGDRWFPAEIRDVVAHSDGRLVSVTVTRVHGGASQVLMREFEIAPANTAFREICRWLRALATVDGGSQDQVLDWSVDVASRIVDALTQG